MQKLINKDIEKNREIKRSLARACSREARLQLSSLIIDK